MPPFVRWLLAVALAIVLVFFIVGVGFFGVMAMAFGSDSCDQIGGSTSTFMLMASPAVMILGVLVAAILFGLNKRWQLWLSSLAVGGALGICGYASWFALVSQWCG